jgi:hypothetical protein
MKPNENGFTIGEHEENNLLYKFRLSNHKYSILETNPSDEESEDKVLLTTSNSAKAYEEWNKIKRPEKFKNK